MREFFKRHPLIILVIPIGLILYFVYFCIGWNVWVSVSDWKGLTPSYRFNGFYAYTKLFTDSTFWLSLRNTLLLFAIIPICIVLGLLLAILMDQEGLKGSNIFRNLFLLPFTLSFVVTGTIWAWMYNPTNGIINSLFSLDWFEFFGWNLAYKPRDCYAINYDCSNLAVFWLCSSNISGRNKISVSRSDKRCEIGWSIKFKDIQTSDNTPAKSSVNNSYRNTCYVCSTFI